MDIVRHFSTGLNQKKFLLVAVDYFSKWVEAEVLAIIIKEAIIRFLWKVIIRKYDIPHKLISNNGHQFQGRRISKWYQELRILQSFTSMAYP